MKLYLILFEAPVVIVVFVDDVVVVVLVLVVAIALLWPYLLLLNPLFAIVIYECSSGATSFCGCMGWVVGVLCKVIIMSNPAVLKHIQS